MSDEEYEQQHAHVRQTILTAYDLPKELTDAWEANHAKGAALECPASSKEKTA